MALVEKRPSEHLAVLVRYVEVWVPTEDGDALQLVTSHSVADGHQPASLGAMVAPGEGVAGRAWHQKAATVLQEEPSELLAMLSQRCGTQLAAVLAIPVFDRTDVRGVVVLGLGEGHGAIEVWSRDDRDELSLSSSWYSGLTGFEYISRYVRFPKGAGIPGEVWKARKPLLVQDPGSNPRFMRSFDDDEAHLTTAIGLPVGSATGFAGSVLLLLPSVSMPLARDVELWDVQSLQLEDTSTLHELTAVHSAFAAADEPSAKWRTLTLNLLAGSKSPQLVTDSGQLPANAEFSLAVPIFRDGSMISVWTMLF